MSVTYDVPSSLALKRVEQTFMAKRTMTSPFFKYFPFEEVGEFDLRWVQRDNNLGLQAVRGLGGRPPNVLMVGDKTYLQQPGVYGEQIQLDERDLTLRRDAAMLSGGPIPIADLVADAQGLLLDRRLNRIEWIISRLVMAGTFSVSTKEGTVVHTDSFTPTTFTAVVPWNTVGTATPLSDYRTVKILFRGQSASGGRDATSYMNQVTANWMLKNTNPNDIGGRFRIGGGNTLNSLADMNSIYLENDLPKVEVYEGGYYDENKTFQLHIADGEAVVIGRRDNNAAIGSYRYVRNVNNPNSAPGPYRRVIDKGDMEIPRSIEVHDGHTGGPTLYYPGCIIRLAGLIV